LWATVLAAGLLWGGSLLAHAAVPESAYAALRWRLVGPLRGGWATVVAGVPGDPATFYFGAAGWAMVTRTLSPWAGES